MHRFTRFTRALIFIPVALLSIFLPSISRVQATHTAGYSIGDTGPGGESSSTTLALSNLGGGT